MPTIVQSCRIEAEDAALLSRQAKRRHLEVSTLSSLYLKEKALEEEYPDYLRWPPALVRCALAYANAYPNEIARQREAEVGA